MGGPLAFKLPFCPCILILHSRIALRYNMTRALHSSHVSIPNLDPVNKRYVEALLLLDSSVNLSIPCPNCVSLLLNPFTELESDAVSCMLTATSLFSELLQFPELMIRAPSVFLRQLLRLMLTLAVLHKDRGLDHSYLPSITQAVTSHIFPPFRPNKSIC